MSFDPNKASNPQSGIFGLNTSPDEAQIHLISVPWDATTSYHEGTSRGPAAILRASHQVDLFDIETMTPYLASLWMHEPSESLFSLNHQARQCALMGHTHQVNEFSHSMVQWVEEKTAESLENQKLVGVVGGDHSVPYGLLKNLNKKYASFGILHVDAHADLRERYEGFDHSHASIMNNVMRDFSSVTKLVQVGIRDFCVEEYEQVRNSKGRIKSFYDAEMQNALLNGTPWPEIVAKIMNELPEHVYVSFDIDGLDPKLCPRTGTPVPGGLSFSQAQFLLEALRKSQKQVIGFDLCEVTPGTDGEVTGDWDANVGARVLYRLCLTAFASLSDSYGSKKTTTRR